MFHAEQSVVQGLKVIETASQAAASGTFSAQSEVHFSIRNLLIFW